MMLSLSTTAFAVTIEHTNGKGETVKLNDFLDTKGHWAHDTILKCAEYGWVAGNNGNFMPNKNIKRGDLAIILDRMLGLKTTTYNFFNDLPNDSYYRDAILRCVAAGYIAGTTSNTVSPEGFATREQVAVILCRMFNLDTSYSGYTGFADDSQIGAWSRGSVYAMKRLGYMNGTGDNRVKPKSYITRAELITLLNNIANTYIPKKDTTSQGSSFKGDYPTNIVTSRNIELTNSTVGRDIILTQASSSLSISNTVVRGRILALGKNSISLSNSTASQIVLMDGKSTITGGDGADEIYIAQYASESSIDKIPNKLVLESGVRVRVDGVMYENTSTKTKIYYGEDLKAAIADEQGYVVGGPKVSGVKFAQDQDNTVTVSGIKVTVGDSAVKEVGVIWLDQKDDEDTVNPTYQNCDGKKVYNSDKIGEPFGFTVGKVSGTRAYRVYVKDKDGLFAYSTSTVFSEYEFSTSLKIYDNAYPEKLDVEVVLRGDSIPDISNIRVVYDVNELYSENHNEVSLRLYSDPDAEVQPDTTKYKRYTATITSPTTRVDGQTVYTPPTAFGYIITFKNGTIINRFPILTNALPDGVSPMSELTTGSAVYNGGNSFTVKNSKITTRYAVPQEVGIVYKTSDSLSVSRPVADASGWTRKSSSVSVGLNESASFDSVIPLNSTTGYTHYAAYVKTSNGYWYGDVKSMSNDVQGDENGYVLTGATVDVITKNSAVIAISYTGKDIESSGSISLGNELGMYNLSDSQIDCCIVKGTHKIYFRLDNLNANTAYSLPIRIYTPSNDKSNIMNVSFNTSCPLSLSLMNKDTSGTYIRYTTKVNSNNVVKTYLISAVPVSGSDFVYIGDYTYLYLSKDANLSALKLNVNYRCYFEMGSYGNVCYSFNDVISVY